jgi:RNA polymerase primary sigma factor
MRTNWTFLLVLSMVKLNSCAAANDLGKGALRKRCEHILQLKIEFVHSDEFETMLSMKPNLAKFEGVPHRKSRVPGTLEQHRSLSCLAPALNEPLFSFAEEQHEFRRMNYLKFIAARIRATLCLARPSRRKIEEIERHLAEVSDARNHIVRSNLRLVISNAAKYCSTNYGFEDLVSDGSLALMEAVDKFDYRRGFRFSTYATHAIRRSFFRKIDRRQKECRRFIVTDPDAMTSTADPFDVDFDAPVQNQLMHQIVSSLGDHLTERELHIVESRFGLNGRSEPRTLMQLSNELGICKERVRQVEGVALQKLHAAAASYFINATLEEAVSS